MFDMALSRDSVPAWTHISIVVNGPEVYAFENGMEQPSVINESAESGDATPTSIEVTGSRYSDPADCNTVCYAVDNVALGTPFYGDRGYTITKLPMFLQDPQAKMIRSANNDKVRAVEKRNHKKKLKHSK